MNRAFAAVIVLGLAATPALAQKVNIDYAHDFDFSTVKTFQYVESDETKAQDPLMADRIVSMIKDGMRQGGLTEVSDNPDVYITYHVTTQERQVLNTTSMGYGGYGAGWYGWGASMGTATTTVSNYTDGTLIIDAYHASDKKLVWRGTGTVTVKDDPEKRIKQVENILAKLRKKWQDIHRGQGK